MLAALRNRVGAADLTNLLDPFLTEWLDDTGRPARTAANGLVR